MMIPFPFFRKPMLAVRYEQVPTPEGTETNRTYGLQFADYFAEKWMWGLQLGPSRLLPLLYPTANLQYDFYRYGDSQFSWGALFSQTGLIRYGTGLTFSHKTGKRWRAFAATQWIAEDVSYETAKGDQHDNFIDMYAEYFIYSVGIEVLMPQYSKKSAISVIGSIGYQDYQSSKLTYEEHSPATFQYKDGVTGFLEMRLYFD